MIKNLFFGLLLSSITVTSQTITELQEKITILEQEKIVLKKS